MGRIEDIRALEAIRDGLGAISQLKKRYDADKRLIESLSDNLLRNANQADQDIISSDYFTTAQTVYFDSIPALSGLNSIRIYTPTFLWKNGSYRFAIQRDALPFWRIFLPLYTGVSLPSDGNIFSVAFTQNGVYLSRSPRYFADLENGTLFPSKRAYSVGKDLFRRVMQTNIHYLKWGIIDRLKKFASIYEEFEDVDNLMGQIPANHLMYDFNPDTAEDEIDEAENLLEIATSRLEDLKRNPYESSLSEKKRDAQKWMNTYAQQAAGIRNLLVQRYSDYLLERDWGNLDLILYLLLSNRASSIPEAFRIISEETRHDQLLSAINNASNRISQELVKNRITSIENTTRILSSLNDVRSRIAEIPNSITVLANESHKQAVSSTSSQMAADVRYMAMLAEQAEIRRRNNVG